MNTLAFRDSVVLGDESFKILNKGTQNEVPVIYHEHLKMRKNQIRGAHLWHEEFSEYGRRGRYELYASDALVEEARARGLTGFEAAIKIAEI